MNICEAFAENLTIHSVSREGVGVVLVQLFMLGYHTGYRCAEVAAVKAQVEGK